MSGKTGNDGKKVCGCDFVVVSTHCPFSMSVSIAGKEG